MKYLNGRLYVEVKDKRCRIHATEKFIIRKRDPPQSLKTQYQVQNVTKIRKSQRGIRNDNDELVVKDYTKNKQPIQQQMKLEPPNCPSCEKNDWL